MKTDLCINDLGEIIGKEGLSKEQFKRKCEEALRSEEVQFNITQECMLIHSFGLFNYPISSHPEIQKVLKRHGHTVSIPRLSQIKKDALNKVVRYMREPRSSRSMDTPTVIVDIDENGQIQNALVDQEMTHPVRVKCSEFTLSAEVALDQVPQIIESSLKMKLILVPMFSTEWPFDFDTIAAVTYCRRGLTLEVKVTYEDLSEKDFAFDVLNGSRPGPNFAGHVINSQYSVDKAEIKVWVTLPIVEADKKKEVPHVRVHELQHNELMYIPMPHTYENIFIGKKWNYQKRRQENGNKPLHPWKPPSPEKARKFTPIEQATLEALDKEGVEQVNGKYITQMFSKIASTLSEKGYTPEQFYGGIGSLIKKGVISNQKTSTPPAGIGIFWLTAFGRALLPITRGGFHA